MKILNDIITNEVLPVIQTGLIDCNSSLFSVIIPVNRGKEIYWIEYGEDNEKRCDPVHLNDKSDLWVACVVNSQPSEVIQEMGKKKRYNVSANIDVIGYSKVFRQAPDYVVSRLATIPFITIKDQRYNSYDILKRMVNVPDYNPQHDLFSINIELKYKTDFCTSETLTGVGACANVY